MQIEEIKKEIEFVEDRLKTLKGQLDQSSNLIHLPIGKILTDSADNLFMCVWCDPQKGTRKVIQLSNEHNRGTTLHLKNSTFSFPHGRMDILNDWRFPLYELVDEDIGFVHSEKKQ